MSTTTPVRLAPALLSLAVLGTLALPAWHRDEPAGETFRDDFVTGGLDGWRVRDGDWAVEDGRLVARGTFAVLLHAGRKCRDFEAAADVAYCHTDAHAAAGIVFRYSGADGTGYVVGLREVERGKHPEFGPWERPVLQL
ncbi:MAG: hypothetical protein ACJ780_11460, partial [Solirubrobacteraceae bacterium]